MNPDEQLSPEAPDSSGANRATPTERLEAPVPEASVPVPTSPASAAQTSTPVSGTAGRVAPQPGQSRLAWLGWGTLKVALLVTLATLLLLAVGLAQRNGWLAVADSGASEGSAAASSSNGESLYICPMMCTPPSTEPGRCPVCGMELVKASSGGGGDGVSVTIEPAARRMLGIQTAVAQTGAVERTIRTIGSIDYDESRLTTISAYVDGRLEKMYADYVGVPVSKGDDLALIYSPKLYSAQAEYVASLEGSSLGRLGGGVDLSELAEENLSELGMTEAQIDNLRNTRKPESRIRISSPQSGTVIEKATVEGDYVKTGQKIYQVADLSSVWLMLDLFPDDAAVIRFGQQVEAEVSSYPGEVFTGRVAFIAPTVDSKTRTVRVRVEMLNFDGKLRPGDYATARVSVPAVPGDQTYDPALANKYISPMHPQIIRDAPGQCPLCGMDLIPTSQLGFSSKPLPEQQVVTVPRNAVLMAGDNSVLYVATEPGRFEVRRVSVGMRTDDEAVIIAGLAAGETVATDGNFLIDSQMQLSGNPSLLDPSKAPAYPPGPLPLPESEPVLLAEQAGAEFDAAYAAYFEIQAALAADQAPPSAAVRALGGHLSQLVVMPELPDAARRELDRIRRHVDRLNTSLDEARDAFRNISHGMLRAATLARGPETSRSLAHFYCPMVPGGGGDWMQASGKLANPYWGSEMLRCGEKVRELNTHAGAAPSNSKRQS